MNIRANFTERVVVHSANMAWISSPSAGVDRKPLDRVGGEVARATTIVRYQPNSQFPTHIHAGGEEFIVLLGTFQDEHGDFPAGSYIRNPPQSKHQPSSVEGCVIFVKLWQFHPNDKVPLHLQTNTMKAQPYVKCEGVLATPLYKDAYEEVSLFQLEANTEFCLNMDGGGEILVLEGSLKEQADRLQKHSWLRAPINSEVKIKAGSEGAKFWTKTGHLVDVEKQIKRVTSAM